VGRGDRGEEEKGKKKKKGKKTMSLGEGLIGKEER